MSVSTEAADDAADGLAGRLVATLRRWRYVLIALVALAQTGVLAHMVWDRERLTSLGRQIDLDVIPVDPRSLFRGDYVILGYEISQVPRSMIAGKVRRGQQVFVQLSRVDGVWKPRTASHELPAPAAVADGDVVLAGRVMHTPHEGDVDADQDRSRATSRVTLRYGIESFFVPEGTGKEIEREVGAKKVVAHIAVDASGRAAIRALSVDGVLIEAQPLF